MGAWGRGSFENDDAADWVNEFDLQGEWAISSALNRVTKLSREEYLEAPEASAAIAAAEIVAAAHHGDVAQLSQAAQSAFLKQKSKLAPAAHVAAAALAIERVMANSELRDLWHEGKLADTEGPKWVGDMRALLGRLR